jgi:hypothetical protein
VVVNFRSFLLFAMQPRLNCESLENVFVPETPTKRANTPHIHGNCSKAPKRRALLFWLASLSKTSPEASFGIAGQLGRDGKTKSNRQLVPIETFPVARGVSKASRFTRAHLPLSQAEPSPIVA